MSWGKMQQEKKTRVDTVELKAVLLKKVGQESFKRYFHCLNRFLNQKLSKSEFDKSCYRILGRENLPLHNQIIKAILRNACSAKTPPPKSHEVGPTCSPVYEDGSCQGAVTAHHQSSVGPGWSNGVVPISLVKGRSEIRDRRLRDKPSLGLIEKPDSVENGDLAPCGYQRPLHQLGGHAELAANAAAVERGEEVGQASHLKLSAFSRSPLIAPLGIPNCPASTGGARKVLPGTRVDDYISCFDLDGLSDSETLKKRMEQIAASQGLGVTLECANTLNNMVDVYLKRLISSCLELVGSRSICDTSANPIKKQQIPRRLINGLWPNSHLHMQNGGAQVSLLDFKVALELNPQLLGENWPLLLEKISMQGFEE
ncbi:uncharacterized protein LOC141612046 [Silene latifolia]|uniref:uncharacterized protein LOC141612046 n=1 Tax=Silene latifolia TaxID=37657 RepID=UPI003D76FE28